MLARLNAAGVDLLRSGGLPRRSRRTPPGFGLPGSRGDHVAGPGETPLNPGVLFSEFPSSTPGYFCADFSHPRMRPPPANSCAHFQTHPPGLTPKPVPDTPARPHPVQIAQNAPSLAILPSPQPSPRTTQKRPHTRFLRFAFPLPHPPYSTPK